MPTLEFDEPTRTQFTGVVETGSTRKYSEVLDRVEYTIRSTSVGVTGFRDNKRVFSVSFRELKDCPSEVRRKIEAEENEDI
jgi:hypothetical protein